MLLFQPILLALCLQVVKKETTLSLRTWTDVVLLHLATHWNGICWYRAQPQALSLLLLLSQKNDLHINGFPTLAWQGCKSYFLLLVRMQRLKTLSWCKRWADTTHRWGVDVLHTTESRTEGERRLEARRLFNWQWQGKSNTIFAFSRSILRLIITNICSC